MSAEAKSEKKNLRIQKYPDTCGRVLRLIMMWKIACMQMAENIIHKDLYNLLFTSYESLIWSSFYFSFKILILFCHSPKKVDSIHRAVCFAYILDFFPSVVVRNSATSSSDSCECHFLNSLVNKQLSGRAWKQGWSIVFSQSSLVSRQIVLRSTSFPSKILIESMVYCPLVPNLIIAGWFWKLLGSFEPIRNGEIFWMNNYYC